MQNPQMVPMAGMNPTQGPIDGTPMMANGPRRQQPNGVMNPSDQLNTYIYDYFLRNKHYQIARMMLESGLNISTNTAHKSSPSGRNLNGVDGMDSDSKEDLPPPKIPPGHAADNSFLMDWWVQFWDIWGAARGHSHKGVPTAYITHARVSRHAQWYVSSANQR
jgi:hypothetical protein